MRYGFTSHSDTSVCHGYGDAPADHFPCEGEPRPRRDALSGEVLRVLFRNAARGLHIPE